jgi:hypothetical protein
MRRGWPPFIGEEWEEVPWNIPLISPHGKSKPPSSAFNLPPNHLNRPKRGGINRLEKVGPKARQ